MMNMEDMATSLDFDELIIGVKVPYRLLTLADQLSSGGFKSHISHTFDINSKQIGEIIYYNNHPLCRIILRDDGTRWINTIRRYSIYDELGTVSYKYVEEEENNEH